MCEEKLRVERIAAIIAGSRTATISGIANLVKRCIFRCDGKNCWLRVGCSESLCKEVEDVSSSHC